jgi:hypothetical protein
LTAGFGAGVGVTTGRGTGVDLTAGNGRGRCGSCAEKAVGLIINPQKVNIVSMIMLLVFIFYLGLLKAVPPASGRRTFSPGLSPVLDLLGRNKDSSLPR